MDKAAAGYIGYLIGMIVVFVIAMLSRQVDDNTINQCNRLGYDTALKQSGTYYCANELIIEDSYRIEE